MNEPAINGADEVTAQDVSRFHDIDFDELLSLCAIAYKQDNLDEYRECRTELLDRVQKLRMIQHDLGHILL